MMKVLILGSGGREHSLYEKLKESPTTEQVWVLPGNAGIDKEDRIALANPFENDFASLVDFVQSQSIDLVVVGPEQPLVDGVADALSKVCAVFGPTKRAAQIEGSKSWARNFMDRYQIPSTRHTEIDNVDDASQALDQYHPPYVIKADGLAAGKGVTVTQSKDEAVAAIKAALVDHSFGESGRRVVIEEFLPGKEASVFAICDGDKAVLMQPARDYKRAYDNDQGPNTGGMGAITPVDYVDDTIMQQVKFEIIDRAVAGFKAEGSPYRGLLYAGLMIHEGKAKVVEFNCRFGDPETQVLLPLLDEDLALLLFQAATGRIKADHLRFKNGVGLTVVIAAKGYPGSYTKGTDLSPLTQPFDDVQCIHAGTEWSNNENPALKSSGGRIANITATANTVNEARQKIYSQLHARPVDGIFFRSDIGL